MDTVISFYLNCICKKIVIYEGRFFMIDKSKNVWLVRAGEGGYLIDDFISKGIIALGCNEIGDMSNMSTNEDVKEAYRQSHPKYKIGKVR